MGCIMENNNYVLAQSYNKANVQDRLWYVMTQNDLATLLLKEKVGFGDKAYVITSREFYICGNDQQWYVM